jgi:hypothetical protein
MVQYPRFCLPMAVEPRKKVKFKLILKMEEIVKNNTQIL